MGPSLGPSLLPRSDVLLVILRDLRGRPAEAASWAEANEKAPDAAGP
jgi:hypothetical protein